MIEVTGDGVTSGYPASRRTGRGQRRLPGQLFDLGKPRIGPYGRRAPPAELETVVPGRIVRSGHHRGRRPLESGVEIDDLGGNHPEINHIDPRGVDPGYERRGQGVGRRPAIATHGHHLRAREPGERGAYPSGVTFIEFTRIDPTPHVVGLEDGV